MWGFAALAVVALAGSAPQGVDGSVTLLSSLFDRASTDGVGVGYRILANATTDSNVTEGLTGASDLCAEAAEAQMVEVEAQRSEDGVVALSDVTDQMSNMCTQNDACDVGELMTKYFYPMLSLFELDECASDEDQATIVEYLLDSGVYEPLGITSIPDVGALDEQILESIRAYQLDTCTSNQELPSCLSGLLPFGDSSSPESGAAAATACGASLAVSLAAPLAAAQLS